MARDAIELDDGGWMVGYMTNFFRSALAKKSSLVMLTPDGGLVTIKELQYPELSIAITALLRSDTGSTVHALGFASDSVQGNGYGFVHYRSDQAMDLFDSARFVFDTLTDITLENATLDQDGNIFLASGAKVGTTGFYNRILLMKLSQSGDPLSSILYGSGNGLTHPRQAIQYVGNMMVATDGATMGPSGYGKFLQFNDQLEYVTGFSSLSLSGTGSVGPVDSVMRRSMSLYALPSGNVIVSACYGNWFPDGYRAVIGKLTGTGEPLQYFFPRSDLFHDYAAELSGIEQIDDGTYLYAMLEGFNADPPGAPDGVTPSRVHIFRMDTSLNVICDYVVDGFADSTYYYLQRVKRTSDGGTLLIGSRQDLNIPDSPPIAWVQKLGPDDCVVGVADHTRPTALVFPNPGTSGFTIRINGPVLNKGRLVLLDGLGRQVAETSVVNSTAEVAAGHLAVGMYHYRIVDATGQAVASGKWVKQ